MPVYDYECTKCKENYEIEHSITDRSVILCPKCAAEMKRLISNTSFVLKGTGWFKDGY